MTLVQYFKANRQLETNIGSFEFVSNVGQGGNAQVMRFTKGGQTFVIKFIPHDDQKKVHRFMDEFFCAAQIPTHPNVVHSYHFDTRDLNGTRYSLIVMKSYATNLHAEGTVVEESASVQSEKAKNLFFDLLNGLGHLHANKIVHRDLKPQNIFFDQSASKYVIGDLGIAHFGDFAKEAHTKPAERLANFVFSAPEQADSRIHITPAADLFAFGQVMQWYLRGVAHKGSDRLSLASPDGDDFLKFLDEIVDRCLRQDPADRFQTSQQILDFLKEKSKLRVNPWDNLHRFDESIRRSFPLIRDVLETDTTDISKFIDDFQATCSPQNFWYVNADGGDNTYGGLRRLDDATWLLNSSHEVRIRKLIIYRDPHQPYKNFFILLLDAMEPFQFEGSKTRTVARRKKIVPAQDLGILFEGKYLNPDETENGFYRRGEQTIKVSRPDFETRFRYLQAYAVLVVPQGAASSVMLDRQPGEDLLASVIKKGKLTKNALKDYLDQTRDYHSEDITRWT